MVDMSRRAFSTLAVLTAGLSVAPATGATPKPAAGFVQINRLTAKSGRLDALRSEIGAMVNRLGSALLYEVLLSPDQPDDIWTIELWPSAAAHDRAVKVPEIEAGIERCKVLVARFENIVTIGLNPAAP